MENTPVVIVGAGPAGLVLALSLAAFNIQSVILEKEAEIPIDPRGVFLTGDAVRILYDLGLGDKIEHISHVQTQVKFHTTSFSTKPFFELDAGNALQQAVPEGILHMQPRLEGILRDKVAVTEQCQLRIGCTVTKRISEEPPEIEYVDRQGEKKRIRSKWLVGADGKTGIVRKHFLEPTAGIKQEHGTYRYEGTWVAANLRISLPTPESHPDFPLWKLSYTPLQVYDLFWPQGWHFCSPPGKPTASGRFGPYSERLWRHEFREDGAKTDMNCEALLWDHLGPMIRLERDSAEGREFGQAVAYPRDCIKVLRCRPFTFTHKVVNRWFDKRTILIGDAAHVFPPFAGQGIGSGFRDAHQLAWRLALLVAAEDAKVSPASQLTTTALAATPLLWSWERERRSSVEDAAFFSMLVGTLCNKQPSLLMHVALKVQSLLERCTLLPLSYRHPLARKERQGFSAVAGGFYHGKSGGGIRLAQIRVRSSLESAPCLSDSLLQRSPSVFTVIAIAQGFDDVATRCAEAAECISNANLDAYILAKNPVVIADKLVNDEILHHSDEPLPVYVPHAETTGSQQTAVDIAQDQDISGYFACLGKWTRFVIARPDCFVYALARNAAELSSCLDALRQELML